MNARLFASLALVASASAISAQTPSPDERTLLKYEDDWAVGVVKRDGALFRRLLAPGFIYTEDDKLSTRDEVLHDILSGTDTVVAAHNEDMKVHMFGTTGIVTGWLIVVGKNNGPRVEHRYRFTDTWVKRNNDWQIVAAQDYLVPARR